MKIYLFLLLSFISLSCSESKEGRKDFMKPDYTIHKGDTFQLSLNSNPSTGYSWQWANKNAVTILDTTIVMKYHSPNNGLVGSGGQEVWTFKGHQSGIDSIILKYARPWDASSTVETKKIIVKVL